MKSGKDKNRKLHAAGIYNITGVRLKMYEE